MGRFGEMVRRGDTIDVIATYLDSLSQEERIKEVQSFPGKLEKSLFQIAKGGVTLETFLPSKTPPLKEVIFYGKNSLPVFNIFQKRMCRSVDRKMVFGYNHQSLQPITGPGCFVVDEATDRPGEVMIDYTRVPTSFPPEWPEIKSSNSGISSLVYGHMKDFMRQVSKNVFIGEATKKGKILGQYFILLRSF